MMKIRFIGDSHGRFDLYDAAKRDCERSIHVGDVGLGFGGPDPLLADSNHRFLRGNHDNPTTVWEHPAYIPDGTWVPNLSMLLIGGASSIDKDFRIEGRDWWANEELSYGEFDNAIEDYREKKPRVMVTHDCPEEIGKHLFSWMRRDDIPSITRKAFQYMFEFHKPDLWIFGHHHAPRDENIFGTRFICIDVGCWIDLDIKDDSDE